LRSDVQLIWYDREDKKGPKTSNFSIITIKNDQVTQMKEALNKSNGQSIVVKKDRLVYFCGQTRIHLDKVEGLGNFVELEVVLRPNQTIEEGQAIANQVIKELELDSNNFIECAYADLLM
jgi:predicted adenylyl cyclase CyaB